MFSEKEKGFSLLKTKETYPGGSHTSTNRGLGNIRTRDSISTEACGISEPVTASQQRLGGYQDQWHVKRGLGNIRTSESISTEAWGISEPVTASQQRLGVYQDQWPLYSPPVRCLKVTHKQLKSHPNLSFRASQAIVYLYIPQLWYLHAGCH